MSLVDLLNRIIDAARKGDASEFDIATLKLIVLERHELATIEQAIRVVAIERSLSPMKPGERRGAVCARLGISTRTYYDMRKLRMRLSAAQLRRNV